MNTPVIDSQETFEVTVSPRIAIRQEDASCPGVRECITHFLFQTEQLAGCRIDGVHFSSGRLEVAKGPEVIISATVRPHTRSGIVEGQTLAAMLDSHRNPDREALRPPVSEIERTAEQYFDRLFAAAGHKVRVSVRYAT